MHTYTLKIAGTGGNAERVIQFESQDAAGALNLLSTNKSAQHAELWDGVSLLCTIDRDVGGTGVWKLNG
ncbi:hypothetical protein [Croceicoccus mobilis]|uniref:Uncharacterized protein n=1 Tax=Croceicoccus mobilis TaxID=1703339 RepID=A0A916Z9U0_9SPHN|nr:hypothetical protein [Croceicoccus mobilis]GGD83326.1 hypothetical protein GCM10010990_36770 [Croceicoccus mobilis]